MSHLDWIKFIRMNKSPNVIRRYLCFAIQTIYLAIVLRAGIMAIAIDILYYAGLLALLSVLVRQPFISLL